MCWATFDIGRTVGRVAKNDIEVYKVMVMKPLEDEELFYSAYRDFPYKKGDLYKLGSQIEIDMLREESITYYRIFKGFHSYNSQSTFLCKEHNNIGESLAVYSIDKGRSVIDVLNENPAYVEWCINNIKWFSLDDTEQKMLNEITKAINIVYYQYPDSFPRGKGASKILYERAFEYLENKEEFAIKYKKSKKYINSADYIESLESMAHCLYKEYDRDPLKI